MILSAQTIRAFREKDPHFIMPFYERTQHKTGMSYGLSMCGYDVCIDNSVHLKPHSFELVSTRERFSLPNMLAMRMIGKSSWTRRGVDVVNTLGEPGWSGYVTFGLVNHSDNAFLIEGGTPIAQVLFEVLDKATEQPYEGKYQSQPRGPVPAIL